MPDNSDTPAEYLLSEEELRDHYRRHPRRGANCPDGTCGGCPQCLAMQGLEDDA